MCLMAITNKFYTHSIMKAAHLPHAAWLRDLTCNHSPSYLASTPRDQLQAVVAWNYYLLVCCRIWILQTQDWSKNSRVVTCSPVIFCDCNVWNSKYGATASTRSQTPTRAHWRLKIAGVVWVQTLLYTRAANDPSVFTITEKTSTRAFSWLKVPTSAFTLKTLIRTLC